MHLKGHPELSQLLFLPCDFHLRRWNRQWRTCSLNWQQFLVSVLGITSWQCRQNITQCNKMTITYWENRRADLHKLPSVSVSVRRKILVNIMSRPPCRILGGQRPATDHRMPGSIPRRIMLHIWNTVWCWDTVLTAFVKLRKVTVSRTMSVCPLESTRLPLDEILWNFTFDYLGAIYVENIQNLRRITDFCMKNFVHFWYYLVEFFLEWETFQAKVVVKIETNFMFSNIFPKIVPFKR